MSETPDKQEASPKELDVEAESTKDELHATTEATSPPPTLDFIPSAETSLNPGDASGDYTIEAVINEGTFGIVYRASQATEDRKVALKVAKAAVCSNQEQMGRFLEEAKTLAKIQHPGIVPVFDSGEWRPGVPFVAMRLLKSDSLHEIISRGELHWKKAAEFGIAIADALAYAHERGVVHRDLKPANILLDEHDNLLLADFGLALHYDNQASHENELAGTVAYMSPEQIRREAHWLDGRTDIWSLGVILYEMVANRHPFRSDNRIKLAEEILSREPWSLRQLKPSIPVAFEQIVNKCLRKEVADRYSSATDLTNSLRELVQSDTSVEQPATSLARRNNVAVITGVCTSIVAVLLLAILLIKFFASGAQERDSASSIAKVAKTESRPIDSSALANTTESQEVTASINLFVWDPTDRGRQGIGIRDANALPLKIRDQIRLNVTLNQHAFVYLVWIDSEGKALPVYPWAPGDWTDRPEDEQMVKTLSLPKSSDHGWPLEGAAGTESLVVLARKTVLPVDFKLESRFESMPLASADTGRPITWFQGGDLVSATPSSERGPNFSHAQKIDDPVVSMHRLLHDRLSDDFEVVDAVSFAKHAR